ncbi:hypothetical protein NPX13_g5137 [Xylaria arbuscula]|uniref:Rhodopsin domain-containing protein n=1 Tax=Xylaria arbuscula TaxID=114810 RepID=A0A9W8NF18_9PEZI|nr:hypothetical protein NPX13_g5137 [Xylaria arbuscula]
MGLTLNINEISACGRELFIVDIIFTVITIVFLVLRFWSARISRRKIYPDDIFVLFAFVSKTVLTGAAIWGTFNGLGLHIYELDLYQLTVQVKYWDPKPTGWCRDTIIGDIATVAANYFLDFAVLALPLPVLWSLMMSVRDKLTVTAMFSIGFVTIALISWRLAVTLRTRGSLDWTGSLCKVGEIAELELYLGISRRLHPDAGSSVQRPGETALEQDGPVHRGHQEVDPE